MRITVEMFLDWLQKKKMKKKQLIISHNNDGEVGRNSNKNVAQEMRDAAGYILMCVCIGSVRAGFYSYDFLSSCLERRYYCLPLKEKEIL